MVPVTAALGLVDLLQYEEELRSVFPVSQDHYPQDSITQIQQARAADWYSRLATTPSADQVYAVQGRAQIPFAKVAARAANDTAARRLFDRRIAELVGNPAQQSYALFEMIATLADPTQDSTRLVRNLTMAEQYLTRLHALPSGGYKTRNDSTSVLERQWRAEDTLVVAYSEAGDTAAVLAHTRRAMSYIPMFGVNERSFPLNSAYVHVIKALGQTVSGRAQIMAFSTIWLAMAHRAATELPATTTDKDRRRALGIEEGAKRYVNEVSSWLALLGTPAPSISAHAWFNTPDSVYSDTPKVHRMADGRVHVLIFGGFYSNDRLSVFDRMFRRFPDVDMVFITNTSGSAGPDILEPRDEVTWLSRYLLGVRRFTMPIAVWAAHKVPAGYVPEGHYQVFRPEETPNERPYHENMLGMHCVMIDKRGIIRFYQDVSTRKDERILQERMQLLLSEPASAGAAPTRAAVMSLSTPFVTMMARPAFITADYVTH
jgi:hypothetical protein